MVHSADSIYCFIRSQLIRISAVFKRDLDKKCLVSGYHPDPNLLKPTKTILKALGLFKSMFRISLRMFTFSIHDTKIFFL